MTNNNNSKNIIPKLALYETASYLKDVQEVQSSWLNTNKCDYCKASIDDQDLRISCSGRLCSFKICLRCSKTKGKNEIFYCHIHNNSSLKEKLKNENMELIKETSFLQNDEKKCSIWIMKK